MFVGVLKRLMTEKTHVDENNGEVDLSQPKTPQQYLRLFFSGFAMGSADIVPGVSGGTMAFILGIYETLLDAIKSVNVDVIRMVLKFDVKGVIDHIPFRFLITLALGLGTAVLLLASLLHTLLEEQPTFLFSFFAGLIIASIIAIGVKVKWAIPAIASFLIAGVFAFWIVGLGSEVNYVEDLVHAVREGEDVDAYRTVLIDQLETAEFENASERVDALIDALNADEGVGEIEDELEEALYEASSPVTLFFSGMIAICAMLLPGISGSFILLILGQYATVLGAVKTLDIVSIAAVGAGTVIGIIAFSRVISWLLKNYRNVTVAALVGFMTGSLRLIYMEAESGVSIINPDTAVLDGGQIALVAILILIGFIGVSILDHLQSLDNPVMSLVWRSPEASVDDIKEKATALE